ncbi:hypothetical protein [Butyrivibrio fibrisolvens]|uniref:hypothetical protein n=1 Tax=Butyrivibrio fibrisolvens TaxID=831 RepID=UPI0003B46552|nr:hypothetical protein [Butyrivibrio fibrisolvens]
MNELEKTKNIIESKYYFVIFDAITKYLQENPEEFWFDGDYCYQYWYELGLCDYKIVELYSVTDQGTKIMEILVEASIEAFDMEGIGLMNRSMTEKLRIGANIDSEYENFEVVYVGQHMSSF